MDLSLVVDKVYSVSPASLAVALIAVVAAIAYYYVASKGLPPGPTGLPYLGYWPFLNSKTVNLQMEAFKKKYGDVFSFTSSGRLYINLGTAKAMREAHITKADCFGSRVSDYSLLALAFEDGVSVCNDEPWKVLRKYFLQVLRERGLTSMKEILSGSVYDSINATVAHLRSKNGEPENIMELLTDKCSSILRHTLFGENGVTDEQVREINKHYGAFSECMTPTNLILSGKFAKLMFNVMPHTRNGLLNLKYVERILYEMIHDHKAVYNEDHIRDIIDEYFMERNLRQSKGDPTAVHFTDKALMSSLVQFIGDGVLAVAGFLSIFLKSVTDHPDEQEKIYEELAEVVGSDREPTIEDKNKLTYTNAFILETFRTSSHFLPFFPSQECTKETTLRGFRIPVGSITLMNVYSAHNDPEVYEDPEKFNPSRFISKEDKKRAELPVTFGIGRRSCLGEGFAMMQIFLFLTTLVKNFRLTLAKESDDVLADLVQGKLEMCAHPRTRK